MNNREKMRKAWQHCYCEISTDDPKQHLSDCEFRLESERQAKPKLQVVPT